MESHGRSLKVMEGQGRLSKVKEGHGWSFPITRLTFQVRKVRGGGGWVNDIYFIPRLDPIDSNLYSKSNH